jgi:hypothetical protein
VQKTEIALALDCLEKVAANKHSTEIVSLYITVKDMFICIVQEIQTVTLMAKDMRTEHRNAIK